MKKLKCHCGLVEADIKVAEISKLLGAIAQFVKEKEQ